ncbi:hypothetical protein ZWY2020_010748 [Hordeum vulgare]|nr:hypothetical protein ZWY2020_010748 [Hordeum vulgare]
MAAVGRRGSQRWKAVGVGRWRSSVDPSGRRLMARRRVHAAPAAADHAGWMGASAVDLRRRLGGTDRVVGGDICWISRVQEEAVHVTSSSGLLKYSNSRGTPHFRGGIGLESGSFHKLQTHQFAYEELEEAMRQLRHNIQRETIGHAYNNAAAELVLVYKYVPYITVADRLHCYRVVDLALPWSLCLNVVEAAAMLA